jgi:hypothetical protein
VLAFKTSQKYRSGRRLDTENFSSANDQIFAGPCCNFARRCRITKPHTPHPLLGKWVVKGNHQRKGEVRENVKVKESTTQHLQRERPEPLNDLVALPEIIWTHSLEVCQEFIRLNICCWGITKYPHTLDTPQCDSLWPSPDMHFWLYRNPDH